MKFLVIRFSSIGDIVLTTPVIRCLKKQVPNCTIHFITKQSMKDVMKANPYIDKFHTLGDDEHALIEELKNEIAGDEKDTVAIIDLHNNIRTLRIKRALVGIKAHSFRKLNIQKWLYTNLRINNMPNIHIVDRYMETLQAYNVHNDGAGLDYFIPELDYVKTEDIPAAHSLGYIGIVVGASYATKKLPIEKLKELVQLIEYPIMLLGGPEDRAMAQEVAQIDTIRIYNACGKFNINESADLVRRAKVIISNDTGLMHMAAAFKKKIISLWGATVPIFGMAPYQTEHVNMHAKLRCQPCSKLGSDSCPKKHFKCMNTLPMQQIATQAMAWARG
jgi:ADP-heptose:LPS heptosyltransferase